MEKYEYSEKVAKLFKKFQKKAKGVQNNIFKVSLHDEDRIRNLSRSENLLNGMFYYVFAPSVGLHTNSEVYYKDNNGNWFCDLGLCENTELGLFKSIEGFIPLTDTIIEMFK